MLHGPHTKTWRRYLGKMLSQQVDVGVGGVTEGMELHQQQQQEIASMLCNCHTETDSMTDTQLTVICQPNVTCSALNGLPGATIVSPILLCLSGVTGQIWALYYLYTTTRPQHSRTVFFVLLSTLIWTDLIGKVLTTSPALVAYVHGRWVGGVPLCNFHGFSMMLISLVTHLLVSTMAVERFIGIRHGYFYNKNITTSRTKLLLLGIWLFSVLFCALPLFGVGQYGLQYPGSWCFVNIHVTSDSPLRHLIYTNVFGIFTIVNLLIMVFCNIVVIIVLLEKAMSRRGNFCQATLLCLRLCRQRCSDTSFCAPHRTYRQRELEMQMVTVLLVITVVFVVSWTPIDLRLFLNQVWPHKTREDHLQDLIAVRLTSINQIVDPWAYIICRKVFATRAWRWVRLSLMGSRLLGRESSSHPGGSHKKLSRTAKPPEKIQYKTPYKGGGGGEEMVGVKDVVVVVAKDSLILSPTPPPLPPTPPPLPPPPRTPAKDTKPVATSKDMGGTNEGGGSTVEWALREPKSLIPTITSTATPTNIPLTNFIDSEPTTYATPPHAAGQDMLTLGVVPIPVFTSEQYCVRQLVEPEHRHHQYHHNHQLRFSRLPYSASARCSPTSGDTGQTGGINSETLSDSWVSVSSVLGRRHSWCCTQIPSNDKQYRTQSTQTIITPNTLGDDFLNYTSVSQGHDLLDDSVSQGHDLFDHVNLSQGNGQAIRHTTSDKSPYHLAATFPYLNASTNTVHPRVTSPVQHRATSPMNLIPPHQSIDFISQNHIQQDQETDTHHENLHQDAKYPTRLHSNPTNPSSEPSSRLLNPITPLHHPQNISNLDFCNFNSEGHLSRPTDNRSVRHEDSKSVFIIGNNVIPWIDDSQSAENNNCVLKSISSKSTPEHRDYKNFF
nr:uncharacterized protein LOC128698817 isoform X2 [Cherax quadricarinatus]